MSETRPEALPLGRKAVWIGLGAILFAHIVLALLLFDPKPFVGGDNAGYMILAEALETGRGYRDVHLPNAPRHAQYPPVYPLMLAAARWVGGGLTAYKGLSILCTTASVFFLFSLARERLGEMAALTISAPLALNPVLLEYSHWTLSEAPFVALTLGGLWVLDRYGEDDRWLAAGLVIAALAYLTRAAGLPLLAAVLVVLAWRRDWRRLVPAGLGTAVVVGGWWLWGRASAAESAGTYSSNFLLVNPYAPEQGYVGPGDLLVRLVTNLRLYSLEVLPESLAGSGIGGGVQLMALLAALVVAALALIGWARQARDIEIVPAFTFFYAGLILVWPDVWTDRRFLLPLVPLILYHAVSGGRWVFDFARVRRPVWVIPALGAALVVLTLPGHVGSVSDSQRCQSLYRRGDDLACYGPAMRSFARAAEWVGANTPASAVVVSRKPRLFYVFSGRRSVIYPYTSDDQAMLSFLDDSGAEYVMVEGFQTTYRYLVPVIRAFPDRFQVAQQVGGSSAATYVLRYRGPVSSSDGGDG